MLEKSWKSHGNSFQEFCGNPEYASWETHVMRIGISMDWSTFRRIYCEKESKIGGISSKECGVNCRLSAANDRHVWEM